MVSLAPVLGFSVLGIPSGDTQNTSDLGTGVPKTRGYPNHCDTGLSSPEMSVSLSPRSLDTRNYAGGKLVLQAKATSRFRSGRAARPAVMY